MPWFHVFHDISDPTCVSSPSQEHLTYPAKVPQRDGLPQPVPLPEASVWSAPEGVMGMCAPARTG